jgi:hypothetical protein
LLNAELPAHCEIELEFPGCYHVDMDDGWMYYEKPGSENYECPEEGKCFKYDYDDDEYKIETCCAEWIYR